MDPILWTQLPLSSGGQIFRYISDPRRITTSRLELVARTPLIHSLGHRLGYAVEVMPGVDQAFFLRVFFPAGEVRVLSGSSEGSTSGSSPPFRQATPCPPEEGITFRPRPAPLLERKDTSAEGLTPPQEELLPGLEGPFLRELVDLRESVRTVSQPSMDLLTDRSTSQVNLTPSWQEGGPKLPSESRPLPPIPPFGVEKPVRKKMVEQKFPPITFLVPGREGAPNSTKGSIPEPVDKDAQAQQASAMSGSSETKYTQEEVQQMIHLALREASLTGTMASVRGNSPLLSHMPRCPYDSSSTGQPDSNIVPDSQSWGNVPPEVVLGDPGVSSITKSGFPPYQPTTVSFQARVPQDTTSQEAYPLTSTVAKDPRLSSWVHPSENTEMLGLGRRTRGRGPMASQVHEDQTYVPAGNVSNGSGESHIPEEVTIPSINVAQLAARCRELIAKKALTETFALTKPHQVVTTSGPAVTPPSTTVVELPQSRSSVPAATSHTSPVTFTPGGLSPTDELIRTFFAQSCPSSSTPAPKKTRIPAARSLTSAERGLQLPTTRRETLSMVKNVSLQEPCGDKLIPKPPYAAGTHWVPTPQCLPMGVGIFQPLSYVPPAQMAVPLTGTLPQVNSQGNLEVSNSNYSQLPSWPGTAPVLTDLLQTTPKTPYGVRWSESGMELPPRPASAPAPSLFPAVTPTAHNPLTISQPFPFPPMGGNFEPLPRGHAIQNAPQGQWAHLSATMHNLQELALNQARALGQLISTTSAGVSCGLAPAVQPSLSAGRNPHPPLKVCPRCQCLVDWEVTWGERIPGDAKNRKSRPRVMFF